MLLLPKSNVITDQEHCFFGLISDNSNKAWLFIDLYDVLITNYMITSLYTRQKDLKVKRGSKERTNEELERKYYYMINLFLLFVCYCMLCDNKLLRKGFISCLCSISYREGLFVME